MKEFAVLINQLDSTNKTNQKLEAISLFLKTAENADKLWLLNLFAGKRPKRIVGTKLLRECLIYKTGISDWLFQESYASVGDLAETISLLLPQPSTYLDYSLSEWMDKINGLSGKSEEEKKEFVLWAWDGLPHLERFIFNKLLGGSFRIGVSSKGMINAIAKEYGLDANAVAHSIMGKWDFEELDFDTLIQGGYSDSNLSKPYPFCLAYALENLESTILQPEDWFAEYKWDGIRGQVIKRKGEVFIWSRGEELVTDQFPEIVAEVLKWEGDFVLDGEIIAFAEEQVLNFTFLQKRLNRKNLTEKFIKEIPVSMYLYDILEYKEVDYRQIPMIERRKLLANLYEKHMDSIFMLSPLIEFSSLEDLAKIREDARDMNSEGLMLKAKDSIYHTGRKKGDWWKWKIDPLTIDAVLIYAQKGSGRRSGYYTDYTFAVRDGDNLVSIAKAYSGLTDKEIQEVSRFVNKNAIEKFGPVRTVKPELVFEIAFEGIGWSSRHKSGVALRFPRILRWRKDKTVADIDELEEVKKMIN